MAVRVRIRIEAVAGSRAGTALETTAIVNTGYEAVSEDASLPIAAAQQLGLWPPPAGAVSVTVRGYGGPVPIQKLTGGVRVRVLADDRSGPDVVAGVLLTGSDDEVILSDALSQALGLVPLRPKDGSWCFADELGRINRPSAPADLW